MAGYRRVLEARSNQASVKRLRELAEDPVRVVRLYASWNYRTPADALGPLLAEDDYLVWWNVIHNPRTPAEALARAVAAETDPEPWSTKRHIVAHHPSAAPELRTALLAVGACRYPDSCHYEANFRRSSAGVAARRRADGLTDEA